MYVDNNHQQFRGSRLEQNYDMDSTGSNVGNCVGDRSCLLTLFILYLLQGVPMGLIASLPIILQKYGVNYKQQASFTIIYVPFSLKVLWAPIVDSYYMRRIGRRKSWIIPVQCLIGLLMIIISFEIENWLAGEDGEPHVNALIFSFLLLNILLATQDIAVDGWSITILRKGNSRYSAICNGAGQTLGFFLGYITFMTLESEHFCNTYLRKEPKEYGMVSVGQFLFSWGVLMWIVIFIIAKYKQEKDSAPRDSRRQVIQSDLGLMHGYKILTQMVRFRSFQTLSLMLLTVRVAFAPHEAAASLKLSEAGLERDQIIFIVTPVLLIQTFLPLLLRDCIRKYHPLDIFMKIFPYRLLFMVACIMATFFAPNFISSDEFSILYYMVIVIVYGCYQIIVTWTYVVTAALFTTISNPNNGGTYMTFLTTINNLGRTWPNTMALFFLQILDLETCHSNSGQKQATKFCFTKAQRELCSDNGGECRVSLDGYYVESIICIIFGLVWFHFAQKSSRTLKNVSQRSWFLDDR